MSSRFRRAGQPSQGAWDRRTAATARWAHGVLRSPGAPRRATFLEIVFDLVFVLALALVSQTLVADLTPRGVLHATVPFLAIWWVWTLTALVTTLYNPQSPPLQAVTMATMLGAGLMATAIPAAFGDRALVFAGAYVAIHLGRGAFFAAALRSGPARNRAMRVWIWFGISAVPWLVGAMMTGSARDVLWILALAVDYAALALGFPIPRWRELPSEFFAPTAEHLAERYHQFFAIALGDIILVGGLVFSHGDHSLGRIAAFLSGFASALLLWRLYTHCAGEMLQRAISTSSTPGRFAQFAPYTHLLMVAGVVATGAGAEMAIEHPWGPVAWGEIAMIFSGPLLFLLGRARFDYEIFGRMAARSLPAGAVALIVLSPAMRLLPPLLVAVTANLVLLTIAGFDTLVRRRDEQLPPAPPV